MSKAELPILSRPAQEDPRVISFILIGLGILGLLMGLLLNIYLPQTICPFVIYGSVSLTILVSGLFGLVYQPFRRILPELVTFIYLIFYLAIVFLVLLNNFDPRYTLLLVGAHVLFAVTFRNFIEFTIFAIASIGLLFLCTQLTRPPFNPYLLISLVTLITLAAGVHVWLRESQELLRAESQYALYTLLNQSTDSLFILDGGCRHILYQNAAAYADLQQINGKDTLKAAALLELLGLDRQFLVQRFKDAPLELQEKGFCNLKTVEDKDLFFTIYVHKIRVKNEDGLLIRLRDITDQRMKELHLSNRIKVDQALIHALPDTLVTLDRWGVIRDVHYTSDAPPFLPQPSEGKFFSELLEVTISGDDREALNIAIERVINLEEPQQLSIKTTHEEVDRYYEMRMVPLATGGIILIIIREITEAHETAQALKQSESNYRALVENMNDGVVLTDNDCITLFVNDRLCKITGKSRDELVGTTTCEMLADVDHRRELRRKFAALNQGKSFHHESRVMHPDGKPLWLSITATPFKDVTGDVKGGLAIITDISEEKLAAQKLQEKNEMLDTFVYKASHDLKGPLASIIGVTNIANDEVDDPIARKYFNFISQSTRRLDNILMEMLDVSRLSRNTVTPELIDLKTTVNEIVDSLKHQPHADKIEFIIDVPEVPGFETDQQLLISILQNLILNSINYHDSEKNDPFVHISAKLSNNFVSISVKDNGVGIPDRIKPRVFEMFYRGNKTSKGSGLGLYIVKNSVQKLHGIYSLTSEPGEGTVFIFTLPLSIGHKIGLNGHAHKVSASQK